MKLLMMIILGILIPIFSFGIDEYQPGDKLYSWAVSGLNLRESPEFDSKVLTKILFGEEVITLDRKYQDVNNENSLMLKDKNLIIGEKIVQVELRGTWARVKYRNQEGYIFDAYLSRFKPLPKNDYYITSLLEYFIKECGSINYIQEANLNLDYGMEKIALENGIFIKKYFGTGGYSFQITIPDFSTEEAFLIIRYLDNHAIEIIQKKNGDLWIGQEMGGYTIESFKDMVIISGAWSC